MKTSNYDTVKGTLMVIFTVILLIGTAILCTYEFHFQPLSTILAMLIVFVLIVTLTPDSIVRIYVKDK